MEYYIFFRGILGVESIAHFTIYRLMIMAMLGPLPPRSSINDIRNPRQHRKGSRQRFLRCPRITLNRQPRTLKPMP